MTTFRVTRLPVAALFVVAASLAHAGDPAMPMPGSAADKALMGSMDAMHKDMAAPMTGDPDRDFVAMMLPHHAGAVAMARIELQYGRDPLLRAMAKDIVASQEKEIATMKGWQARHAR